MKINTRKVTRFLKENRVMMVQLTVMGYVAFSGNTTFAGSASSSGGSFTAITGPLQALKETMTGPIATTIGTVGIGAAALATGLNMENQVLKRSIQLTGGTAGALGATSLIDNVATSAGLLF